MANNFLNRRSLNINLYNKSPYVQKSFQNTLKHGYLSMIKDSQESVFDRDEDSLGIYIAFSKYCKLEDNKIKLNYHENNLIIDSSDRDFTFFKNPFEFVVKFDPLPSDNGPIIERKGIKNIKYILIDTIRIPLFYSLNRTISNPDNDIISLIKNNIINDINNKYNLQNLTGNQLQFTLNRIQNIYSNKQFNFNNGTIEICNFVLTDINNWQCNYTLNTDNTTAYLITNSNNNYSSSYYKVSTQNRIDNANIVYLQIKELTTTNISTDSTVSFYAPLYPKKITKNINPMIQFDCKKNLKIYKDTDLQHMDKLSICLYDNNYKKITNLFLDNTVNATICKCGIEDINYSCSCYYLRHPGNPMWQMNMLFKVGNYDINFSENK